MTPEAIRYLVVHCSDSPNDEDVSASDIHTLHLSFGWHGIGYHRVIRRNGQIERGRPEYWAGAHVLGFNAESLGVCLIGCDDFTDAQWNTLEVTLKDWKHRYPQAQICGHCDFEYTEKTCPNFNVAKWCEEKNIR